MAYGSRAAGAPRSFLRAAFAVAATSSAAAQSQCDARTEALALDASHCQDVSLLQHGAAKRLLAARHAAAGAAAVPETGAAVGEVAGVAPGGQPPALDRGGALGGRGLMAEWTRARHTQPALFQPAPLRQADLDLLVSLNRTIGGVAATAPSGISVPPGWVGPNPPPPSLWGGPSIEFNSASFKEKVIFPSDDPAKEMNYARPGSDIPDGLWGIWWMDQAGFSTVAKDPSYPFAMFATPEMLASFGPEMPGSGVDKFGAHYEKDTRCVTPIPCYGGPQWAAFDNSGGEEIFAVHGTTRNTLSFCYGGEGSDHINIFQKQQWGAASFGPIKIGDWAARLLGSPYAGDGFYWTPDGLINMTMEKKSWGWDRVTTVGNFIQPSPLEEWVLQHLLPSWLWQLVKLALAWQKTLVSHYPLLQIIDGEGKPTKYMDEWLAYTKTKSNGGTLQVRYPGPKPPAQ